jgi:hypothetical protein
MTPQQKLYLKNFIQYILIVSGVIFAFGFFFDDGDYSLAYVVVSLFCIILLGNKIASEKSNNAFKKPKNDK